VHLTGDAIEFTAEEGNEPVVVSVRGRDLKVGAAGPVSVPLADQGPRIEADISLAAQRGGRREDGSLITATVPGL
jgi:alpha,alpha-trehalose phosphorylase